MITKITEALTNEYANTGVGEKAFNGVANLLSKTVNEETDITAYVKEDYVKGLITAIQGSVDSERNKRAEIERQLNELKSKQTPLNTPPAPPAEPPKQDEMPSWAKVILEEVKTSKAEVENIKREKSMEQKKKEAMEMFSKLNISDNTKGLANKAQSWVFSNVKDEDTAETLYTRMKDEYDSLASSIGLNAYKPIPSGGGGEKPEKKWAAEAEKRKAQAQSKN